VVQAEILAASVTAALDFRDPTTAQEAVDALRVNSQVTAAGVYDDRGILFVGYERGPSKLARSFAGARTDPPNRLIARVPVTQGGERIGNVYVASLVEPVTRRLSRYVVIGLLVLMAALVIAVLGFATGALRRANEQLAERADALADAYEQLRRESEERANAEEQLRQAQKMQALGQLTGGIAHDFNNLLTVIQGSADILRRPGLAEEKRLRFADAIVNTAERAATLTGQLLAFARRQPLQPESFDLNERILAMKDILDRTLGEHIKISTELTDDLCPVEADPAQLESALLNVAVNSRDAMPNGGTLTIRTGEGELGEGRKAAMLTITDSGVGIDEETLARVFEPFFTTKAVGKGTGLGLSQVYGFATQSGGDVRLNSEPGQGTTVTILLPCSEALTAAEPPASRGTRTSRCGRILVVDDNEEVGAFAEVLLAELGHDVMRVKSGAEALNAISVNGSFDVVFTDVVMAGMSGLELAEQLKLRVPRTAIVLTTGYSDEVITSGTGGLPVVFKPYRLETLAAAFEKVMGPPAAVIEQAELHQPPGGTKAV
jgi:signal transduction histidine kinase/CheY-like chemotaxis protein